MVSYSVELDNNGESDGVCHLRTNSEREAIESAKKCVADNVYICKWAIFQIVDTYFIRMNGKVIENPQWKSQMTVAGAIPAIAESMR